jgi:hypothetical protein
MEICVKLINKKTTELTEETAKIIYSFWS